VLTDIQAYLRRAASYGRETARIGPFLATFAPGSASPYLNYAIPDEAADPRPEEIAALVAAYAGRERRPRLEYLPDLAPAVEPALVAAGFTVEARMPMMVCRPAEAVPTPPPEGIELLVPRTRAEFAGLIAVQRAAFGEDEPVTDAAVDGMHKLLADGGLAVLAKDTQRGVPAGAGVATVVLDGATELVGLAVPDRYRRRGIAAAVTAELSRLADRAGVTTAFLTPGGDVAERVYARVGYRGIGDMLHISRL
jgi:GNAT superfamily N-acetyltransferase